MKSQLCRVEESSLSMYQQYTGAKKLHMQPFLKRAKVLSLMKRKFYLVKFLVLYSNIWFLHSKNLKLSEAHTIQQCEQKEHSVCVHRCTSGWERVSDCLPPLHHLVASVCGRAWISMESWGLTVDPHGCVVWVSLTDHYSSPIHMLLPKIFLYVGLKDKCVGMSLLTRALLHT